MQRFKDLLRRYGVADALEYFADSHKLRYRIYLALWETDPYFDLNEHEYIRLLDRVEFGLESALDEIYAILDLGRVSWFGSGSGCASLVLALVSVQSKSASPSARLSARYIHFAGGRGCDHGRGGASGCACVHGPGRSRTLRLGLWDGRRRPIPAQHGPGTLICLCLVCLRCFPLAFPDN
jgi:hypothetical protein